MDLGYGVRWRSSSRRTLDSGSAQREKLLAEVVGLTRRMTAKGLQVAVQLLEAVASGKTRSAGKA
jgi:hypothetical protein